MIFEISIFFVGFRLIWKRELLKYSRKIFERRYGLNFDTSDPQLGRQP